MAEQVLEDIIVGGFGSLELRLTQDTEHPLELWPVDGATIKLRPDWDGKPESPRYVQVTGRFGPEGQVVLANEELSYIRLNPRTHTPFGLGRLEVAFETIANFLTAHRHASKLANNSVAQYALWLDQLDAAQHERLIRWWQDEVEGTGKVPIMSSPHKPEVMTLRRRDGCRSTVAVAGVPAAHGGRCLRPPADAARPRGRRESLDRR